MDMIVSFMSIERVEPQDMPLYTYVSMCKGVFYFKSLPMQFDNYANPQAHEKTTAKEIIEQMGDSLDAVACGVTES